MGTIYIEERPAFDQSAILPTAVNEAGTDGGMGC